MANWISALGIIFSAAALMLTWVKLKPSERRLAKHLGLGAWRIASNVGMIIFFAWSNYHFFTVDGPITRLQILLLIIVYAEVAALAVIFALTKILDRILGLQERMIKVLDKTVEHVPSEALWT